MYDAQLDTTYHVNLQVNLKMQSNLRLSHWKGDRYKLPVLARNCCSAALVIFSTSCDVTDPTDIMDVRESDRLKIGSCNDIAML